MSDSTNKQDPASPSSDRVDTARRRLLQMAVYVPPTILGIISLQQAGCQGGPSCAPATCGPNGPCNPDNPCAPDGGCPPDNGCAPDVCRPNG
jgi:hypothetical protein